MVALVIEALYALVFVRSFVAYARRRDPGQRDLTLGFAPLTVLLVVELGRRAAGGAVVPVLVGDVAGAGLPGQPHPPLGGGRGGAAGAAAVPAGGRPRLAA